MGECGCFVVGFACLFVFVFVLLFLGFFVSMSRDDC